MRMLPSGDVLPVPRRERTHRVHAPPERASAGDLSRDASAQHVLRRSHSVLVRHLLT